MEPLTKYRLPDPATHHLNERPDMPHVDVFLATDVMARMSELADERDRALEAVYIPGNWFCPQCQFAQSINYLYLQSGTVGPNTDEVPLCPNDGTLMKRATWKSWVDDYSKALTERLNEIDALKAQLQAVKGLP